MMNDAGVMVGFCQIAMIRMMMLMMVMVGMTMMKGATGINMTIRQEATLNWSCVGGRDVALLTTGCGNKEIVAQILRGDDDEEDEDEDKDAGDMIGSAATKRYSRGLWV